MLLKVYSGWAILMTTSHLERWNLTQWEDWRRHRRGSHRSCAVV